MKRILRWTLNGMTILSVLLFLLAGGLWVRSYYKADAIILSSVPGDPATISRRLLVSSNIGGIDIEYDSLTIKPGRFVRSSRRRLLELQQLQEYQGQPRWRTHTPWRGLGYWRTLVRFRYSWLPNVTLPAIPELADSHFSVVVPYWVLVLLFTILPATRWRLAVHRRSKIKQMGKCRRCGYDLRATPDRCPECGTVTPKETARTLAGAETLAANRLIPLL
jgi:hypothetical protein